MARMVLTSSSRSITLPEYMRDGLVEQIGQNFAKNYPLAGNMYVDFFNIRSGWKVSFDAIPVSDYANIKLLFDDQFINEEFLTLTDDTIAPGAGLSVFLNLPAERTLNWDKQAVTGLTITLEPENADS